MINPVIKLEDQHRELYDRLQAFALDQPDSQLSFSKRLARDNGWSLDYTQRVLEEYKKFVFLAVVSGHPVTPSDQVDQVWHLHLSYTRSYWQEFCPQVLQTTLHHEPTRGGFSENLKFDDWYNKTLKSYQQFFGDPPPKDIWPNSEDRFGRDLHFIRINTQQNWILPKPNWKTFLEPQLRTIAILALFILLSLIVTSCQGISKIPNPINFTGPEFLVFYIAVSIIGIALAYWLRSSLCASSQPVGKRHPNLNLYEIAFLAGGSHRMLATAIINLVKQGHARVISEPPSAFKRSKCRILLRPTAHNLSNFIEKKVVKFISATDGTIEQIVKKSTDMGNSAHSRMQNLGLFLTNQQITQAKIYPSLILVILLGLGLFRLFVGLSRGKPVGFLLICLFVLTCFLVLFLKNPPYRSRYGDQVLADLKATSRNFIPKDTTSKVAYLVALGGTAGLTTEPALLGLYQMLGDRPGTQTSYQGSQGGAGCGGAGCGG